VSQSTSTVSHLETVSGRKKSNESNAAIAYTILRLSFGANILLHGLSRILNGRPAFLAYLNHYFEHAHLVPLGMLPVFGAILPWVETTLGLLLMLGLLTRFAVIAGAVAMLVLVIGTNLAQDWIVSGLQLIYCFIYYYLYIHMDENRISVDQWWGIGMR